jgi:hypothetical protein
MASTRHAAVGSASWISSEREAVRGFVEVDLEEFAFSAQNEAEWLNEHMAEIFSQNQLFEFTLFLILSFNFDCFGTQQANLCLTETWRKYSKHLES